MKKYLNILYIVILLIILSLAILNYNSNKSDQLEAEVNDFNHTSSPHIIEISNPTFKNKGINENPYEISAKRGIQVNEDIELYEIIGKFKDDDSKLIYINADEGFFRQNNQIIELKGNVLIYDELGNKTSTDSAVFYLDDKKINLLSRVVSTSNTSTIQSNSSIVDKKNNIIIYIGDVQVRIANK